MKRPAQYNVITHLHTFASSGPASCLDEMARSILTDILGEIPADLVWRECFTTVADIDELLAGNKTQDRLDIIFLTDHMSARSHQLHPDFIQLACREPRIGLGCEIQTRAYCVERGCYVQSPEVLLYGSDSRVNLAAGAYTGISQDILDQLYRECLIPGVAEPDIFQVRSFCRRHRILCALAHPFDGHQLDVLKTLEVIGFFDFVETINGGFPHRSAVALREYVDFHNRLVNSGLAALLLKEDLSGGQRLLIEKMLDSEFLASLGGSDAHYNDFDRVVTRFSCVGDQVDALYFVATLLNAGKGRLPGKTMVQPLGRGCTMVGLYKDVIGIALRNVLTYRHYFRSPDIWIKVVRTLLTTGLAELKIRIRRNKGIVAEYQQRLNISDLRFRLESLEKRLKQDTASPCCVESPKRFIVNE